MDMELWAMENAEKQRNQKVTILYRKGGTWQPEEISKLVNGLKTDVSGYPEYPEHLILFGHYTKEEILSAIGGGLAFTASQIIGTNNKEFEGAFLP